MNGTTEPVPAVVEGTVGIDPAGNAVSIDPNANTVGIDPAANTVVIDDSTPIHVECSGTIPGQPVGIPPGAFSVRLSDGNHVVSGPDAEGTSYAITAVVASNRGDTPAGVPVRGLYGETSDCFAFSAPAPISHGPNLMVPPHDTVVMALPQPFVVSPKPGANSCLWTSTSSVLDVTVVGYKF